MRTQGKVQGRKDDDHLLQACLHPTLPAVVAPYSVHRSVENDHIKTRDNMDVKLHASDLPLPA